MLGNPLNKKAHCLVMSIMRYLFFLLLVTVLPLQSCRSQRVKAEKKQERMAEQQKAEEAAAYKQAQQRHQSVQSKETRKRMKQSERQSKRHRIVRKPSIWQRLFRRQR